MKPYARFVFENSNNLDAIKKIEDAASRAIDYARQYYQYAVSNSYLTDDGFLRLTFAEGQNIEDEKEEIEEAQNIFDEKFIEIINELVLE